MAEKHATENKYLKAMQQAKDHLATPQTETAEQNDPPRRKEARSVGRPPGKRSNPDWEQVTLFVRKETKRAAVQRLMAEQSALDLSEVIEQLLSKWAKVS